MTHLAASLPEIKGVLNVEFRKLKSQAQCLTEIKEIKQRVNEFVCDIDQ